MTSNNKQPVDVLATLDFLAGLADDYYGREPPECDSGPMVPTYNAREARAAVAELIEKSRRLEVTANSLRYCYSKRPENFASCLQQLDEDAAELRAALARIGGAK